MQELSLNLPTVILLVVIAALAVLAIRRMTRKGLCDCGDHCGDEGCHGCAGCSAADDMVRAMDEAAKKPAGKGCCCEGGAAKS